MYIYIYIYGYVDIYGSDHCVVQPGADVDARLWPLLEIEIEIDIDIKVESRLIDRDIYGCIHIDMNICVTYHGVVQPGADLDARLWPLVEVDPSAEANELPKLDTEGDHR